MSIGQQANPWKWSTIILAALFVSCISWYFISGDAGQVTEEAVAGEDMSGQGDPAATGQEGQDLPVHEVEQGHDYSSLASLQEASGEPIRKVSTIAKGDSLYAILQQNGVSNRQAYDILTGQARSIFQKIVPAGSLLSFFHRQPGPHRDRVFGLRYIADHSLHRRREHPGAETGDSKGHEPRIHREAQTDRLHRGKGR